MGRTELHHHEADLQTLPRQSGQPAGMWVHLLFGVTFALVLVASAVAPYGALGAEAGFPTAGHPRGYSSA